MCCGSFGRTRGTRKPSSDNIRTGEPVVMVGENIAWSRLYRDHEDSRLLGQMSEGTRIDFERLGWTTDPAS